MTCFLDGRDDARTPLDSLEHFLSKASEGRIAGTIKFVDLCAGLGGFHHGLSTAAQTAASRYGHDVRFECVAAAELESDLRKAYVSNFPEIAEQYRKLHFDQSVTSVVDESTPEGLRVALPRFNGTGDLLQIHGDMTWLLDESQSNLRIGPAGRPLLPAHDLLCAGFPCQPFSKSGAQLGFEDTRGTVFHTIATILREHRPAFIFLENVGNFPKHDEGNTWIRVRKILEDELGYYVVATNHVNQVAGKQGAAGGGLISPHHLGYPHHRERFFIVGQRRDAMGDDSALVKSLLRRPLEHASVFPSVRLNGTLSPAASRLLDQRAKKSLVEIISRTKMASESTDLLASQVSAERVRCIRHWGSLLDRLAAIDAQNESTYWRDSMPSFPIWGYELDPWHWYPIDKNPRLYCCDFEDLSTRRKIELRRARDEILKITEQKVDLKMYPPTGERDWLAKNFTVARIADWARSWPAYAGKREEWPRWKQRFILQNREWAIKLWSALDPAWLRQWLDVLYDEIEVPSLQKLEWNCKGEELDIWMHILQFRPSGLRVKRLAHVPALVAMTTTQIPIVPRLNPQESTLGSSADARGRHLIASEALELQGFPSNWSLPMSRERAFTCFGNAVHVGVVRDIALGWLLGSHTSNLAVAAFPGSSRGISLGDPVLDSTP